MARIQQGEPLDRRRRRRTDDLELAPQCGGAKRGGNGALGGEPFVGAKRSSSRPRLSRDARAAPRSSGEPVRATAASVMPMTGPLEARNGSTCRSKTSSPLGPSSRSPGALPGPFSTPRASVVPAVRRLPSRANRRRSCAAPRSAHGRTTDYGP
jgi:hypothetical protein